MSYAEKTTVSVEKSRIDIEQFIRKHGATQFVSGYVDDKAMIGLDSLFRYLINIAELKNSLNRLNDRDGVRCYWL